MGKARKRQSGEACSNESEPKVEIPVAFIIPIY